MAVFCLDTKDGGCTVLSTFLFFLTSLRLSWYCNLQMRDKEVKQYIFRWGLWSLSVGLPCAWHGARRGARPCVCLRLVGGGAVRVCE